MNRWVDDSKHLYWWAATLLLMVLDLLAMITVGSLVAAVLTSLLIAEGIGRMILRAGNRLRCLAFSTIPLVAGGLILHGFAIYKAWTGAPWSEVAVILLIGWLSLGTAYYNHLTDNQPS